MSFNQTIAGFKMTYLVAKSKAFLSSESGTTSVEYAVMLALVIGLCIAAITLVGTTNGDTWSDNSGKIGAALQ